MDINFVPFLHFYAFCLQLLDFIFIGLLMKFNCSIPGIYTCTNLYHMVVTFWPIRLLHGRCLILEDTS